MGVKQRISAANLQSYDGVLKFVLWHQEKLGMNIVPLVSNEKRPSVPWKGLADKPLSTHEIADILMETNSRSIGMLTGETSNRVVIDLDVYKEPEGFDSVKDLLDLSRCCLVQTASGGMHLHFRYNGFPTCVPRKGVEVKSDGALVVIPPTCMPYGVYKYECDDRFVLNPTEMGRELEEALSLDRNTPGTVTGAFRVEDGPTLDGSRDNTVYNMCRALFRGGMSEAEVTAYARKLAASCVPPFSDKEVAQKVKSALSGMPDSRRDITGEVRAWIDTQYGLFDITSLRADLDISRMRWKELNVLMNRLVQEGYIVRATSRSGMYRRRDTDLQPIDVLNTKIETFGVKLPLGLNDMVEIMPKNLIVFAGSQNAGKTALMLNIMRDNMHNHKVRYLSSEMGANEFKSRLSMFDMPIDAWKFEAYERTANFADVIDPNAINIIDYLEIGDAFYQIGNEMAGIFDSLDNGIAIIAIQKDHNMPLGRGGSFSMEKPRLYCTVDKVMPFTRIKIMKAKNWKNIAVDPNHFARDFKIRGGCLIQPASEWEYDNSHTKGGFR